MKVNILYKFREGPWGGGNQFLKALKIILEKRGLYEENPYSADIILFSNYPFNNERLFFKIIDLKRKKKKCVLRIDGPMFYQKKNRLQYDRIQHKFSELFCEGTIFQSVFCEKENKKIGMKKNLFETIIFNAPNKEIFNPSRRSKPNGQGKVRIGISTFSPDIGKGFNIFKWIDDNLDFTKYEVIFMGNSNIKFKNIKNMGPLSTVNLADILKTCDIYLFGSRNECCSNALLEALHLHIPAVSLRSGGNPELIKGGGEYYSDPEELPRIFDKIINNYQSYIDKIELFDIDQVADKYIEFLFKVEGSKKIKKNNYIKNFIFILDIYSRKTSLKIMKNISKLFRKFTYRT